MRKLYMLELNFLFNLFKRLFEEQLHVGFHKRYLENLVHWGNLFTLTSQHFLVLPPICAVKSQPPKKCLNQLPH